MRDYIRAWDGRVIGSYDTDTSGRITLRDFNGRILGKFDPKENLTRDFSGKVVGTGNILAMLLSNND